MRKLPMLMLDSRTQIVHQRLVVKRPLCIHFAPLYDEWCPHSHGNVVAGSALEWRGLHKAIVGWLHKETFSCKVLKGGIILSGRQTRMCYFDTAVNTCWFAPEQLLHEAGKSSVSFQGSIGEKVTASADLIYEAEAVHQFVCVPVWNDGEGLHALSGLL